MLEMLWKFGEALWGKIAEQVAEYASGTVRSIKDFDSTLEDLKSNLEFLSAKATEVEEKIKNAERSGEKKRKRTVDIWLKQVKEIESEFPQWEDEVESERFISWFSDGGATQLKERVDNLIEQISPESTDELVLDVYVQVPLLTTGLDGKAFKQNFERIWGLLVTEKAWSIGIYGMGGVGKTTLMRHIHNKLLEEKECVFWITVSQVFTIKELQDEIARDVGLDLSDERNQDKRAARLHRTLSQCKNPILILDDVWENIDLEKVGYPLSVEGRRLVITTRSKEVCHQIGCRKMIAVETLDMDEAWNLFSKRLETKLTHKVEEIAKRVAKLCGGLPLAIIVLAGSMRGKTAKYEWENSLERLKTAMGQGKMKHEVFSVLKDSFDQLNPNHEGQSNGYNSLQRCFLRCSLYPEDYEIHKEELVRNFISEELMDERESRKAYFNQGLSLLDTLVNVNLLESTDIDGDECVKMHDLVRAMALEITKGETMVIAGHHSLKEIPNEEKWTKDLEKMSLMMNGIWEIPPGMSPDCPKLSTLLLQINPLEFLPARFLSRMRGLCTLDLSRTKIKKLPNSLSDLESLKALLLEGCWELEYVPCLGKLKALKELDLSGTAINEVPPGIEELLNLKFLSINAEKLKVFPTKLLLRFQHLQYLKFPYHIEAPVEEIARLKELEVFWGTLKNMCDFNLFVASTRSPGRDHVFYNIHVGSKFREFGQGYQHLFFHQCNLKTGEGKDETILGQDIRDLSIIECEGLSNCFMDDFQRLSNPKSLKHLYIYECGGIECILLSEQLTELQSQFSTLETIDLIGLRDFEGVIHKREIGGAMEISPPPRQAAAFSSLGWLLLSNCHRMKKLGLPASEFPNLKIIEVWECDEIEEIIADAEGEAGSSSFSLPKLEVLDLQRLPKLKSICKGTMICISIREITLGGCPSLKKLSLDLVPPPPALKEILIGKEETEWWESILEWEDNTHPHLLKPYLRFN